MNSFLLFHEEVDPHGGFEQHVSLPEFDVSGQGLSFGRLESSESSNIDHGLANGLAFGIQSLMFPGVGSEVFEEQVQAADYTHLPLDFYLSGRNSVYSYRRSRVLSAGRGG